ncbi:MAG: fused MFS/spermidine synthase [Sandaracinaceae bacterium]
MSHGMRIAVVLLCFGSGVAGLTYEVLWLRLLAVSLGNASYAASAVLAAVMAGMGLGAWVAGRAIDKLAARRDPKISLRVYGGLEVALGLAAFLVPTLARVLGETSVPWLRAAGPGGFGLVIRFAVAAAVVLVPASLMGATLPVLVRYVRDSGGRGVGRTTGLLYGLNTLGAALGAGLAGFVLLASWGLQRTSTAAAGLDVVVGAVAVLLSFLPARPRGERDAEEPARPAVEAALEPRWLLACAAASGFSVLALETLWARLLTIAAGHDVYAFASMLAAVLSGLASGAMLYRASPARVRRARLLVPGLLAALGLGSWLTFSTMGHAFVARGIDVLGTVTWVSVSRSHEQSILQHAIFAALLVLPTTLAAGALLPALAGAMSAERGPGESLGGLLAANTVGSLVGAFAGPLLLIPSVGLVGSILLVGAAPIGLAAALLLRAGRWRTATGLALLVPLAALPATPSLPRDMLARKIGPAHLRFQLYEEGPTATVAVVENTLHFERTLYLNGINEVTTRFVHDESFSMLGHLPALLHPAPRTALVICLGGGLSAGALAQHADLTSIRIVDLERTVALATRRFEDLNHGVLDDPRVELVIDDGRNHLRTTDRLYDVMVIDSTHPRAVDSWILYTEEMYVTARARLAEGGWMAQWVPLHGLSVDEWRTLVATFLRAFPSGSLWLNAGYEPYGHSGYGLLVGQRGEGTVDLSVLQQRIAPDAVRRDLARWGLGSAGEVLETYVAGPEALRRWTEGAPTNTDDHPRTQFVTDLTRGAPMDVAPMLEVLEPATAALRVRPDAVFGAELARRYRARRLLLGGRLERAEEVCPDCRKYPLYRAQLARGPAYYRALARTYHDDPARTLEAGAGLVELGRVAEGERALVHATELAPDDPRMWLSLALSRAASGDDPAAIRAFRRSVAADPESPLPYVGLGLSLARQGQGAEAVLFLWRALALDPDLPAVHAALGYVLMRQPDESGRAETHLREALSRDPRQSMASVSLGRLLLAQQRAAEAVEVLRAGTRLNPADEDLWFTLGVAYARTDARGAAAAFREALELDPSDAAAAAALAELGTPE